MGFPCRLTQRQAARKLLPSWTCLKSSNVFEITAYPAWKGACLVVGVAVPSRDDEARAREVRDRFVRDVLPKVEVLTDNEPKEKY